VLSAIHGGHCTAADAARDDVTAEEEADRQSVEIAAGAVELEVCGEEIGRY
jgi:hypothetical protein